MYKVLEVNVDDKFYGGVYVLVRDIIFHLPNDIKADIAALEPFESKEHEEELRKHGTDVYYIGADCNKIVKQYRIYKNIRHLLEEQKYDAVHFHSDVSHKILVSALAAKKEGVKKLIFHSHANDVEGRHRDLRRLFHRFCCIYLKSIPATYIATSKEAGQWMFPWANADDIIILKNGIDYGRFAYNEGIRKKIRNQLNIESDFLIGSVGRLVYQKNPLYLLDILKSLVQINPHSKLLHIGDGTLKAQFCERIEELGLNKHVIMLDSTDSIEQYYQAMDVVLLPSLFEGFGLVAVEAQASYTPTIVSEYVPRTTKISDLIEYLPIGEQYIDMWVNAINSKRNCKKKAKLDIDQTYDIVEMTEKISTIYRS